ncbi:hypothetical protein BaRGS_00019335, partial [Batillaria attramentaria]
MLTPSISLTRKVRDQTQEATRCQRHASFSLRHDEKVSIGNSSASGVANSFPIFIAPVSTQ